MSEKKAERTALVFTFDDGDHRMPAIDAAFQQIVQLAQLYTTGDARSRIACRERLMEVSVAWLAWEHEKDQNSRNGFRGAEQAREERKPEWDKWQQCANEIYEIHPHWSKTQVCCEVAKVFGVTREIVGKRVTGVGKPRKGRN